MFTLPEFTFITEQENIKGSGIILQTTVAPYPYAMVHKYETKNTAFFNKVKLRYADFAFVQIDGYNIAISYEGNLEGKRMQPEKIYNMLQQMANWYLNKKILVNGTGYYKKFTTG